MKNKIISLALLLVTICSKAQQNFFNVASSDITIKNKLFFQQQLNILTNAFQSNTTFNYGLGNNYEIGCNILGIVLEKQLDNPLEISTNSQYHWTLNDNQAPYSPFFMINAQKRWDINHKFAFSLGFQQGITITKKTFAGGYYFANGIYLNQKIGLKYVLGIYHATTSFVGQTDKFLGIDTFGIQTGIEKNLWHEKLLFQADFISGTHSLGQTVLGGAYCLTPSLILSAGYQLPTFNSTATKGFVVEFTYVPKNNNKH